MDRFPGLTPNDETGDVTWEAQDTVRELDDRPHLLTRLVVRGGFFPHMNAMPFIRLRGRRGAVTSWFAEVADDNSAMLGYFPVDALRAQGVVEYGYGGRVFGQAREAFQPKKRRRLDRQRLSETVVEVTRKFVDDKQRPAD